jgi:DNA ligase-1
VEESYLAVGDFPETASLLLDRAEEGGARELSLEETVRDSILPFLDKTELEQAEFLPEVYFRIPKAARLPYLKLLTGGFRANVARSLLIQAISEYAQVEKAELAARLSDDFEPSAAFWEELTTPAVARKQPSPCYPFSQPKRLASNPEQLGSIEDWFVEQQWGGVRVQLVKREGQVQLWSPGEELVTDRFPGLVDIAQRLPEGSVLEGEVLGQEQDQPPKWRHLPAETGSPSAFSDSPAEMPATFLATDLLEWSGIDIRDRPLAERRRYLEEQVNSLFSPRFRLSPLLSPATWAELRSLWADAPARGEGLSLRRKVGAYESGEPGRDWWIWESEPHSFIGVLIYAQPGVAGRAGHPELTFGVRNEDGQFVPVAKVNTGLSASEVAEIESWVRHHTRERFGPVRYVDPELVFEIAFKGIAASSRHRAGLALRELRILRWRRDIQATESDTLASLRLRVRRVA